MAESSEFSLAALLDDASTVIPTKESAPPGRYELVLRMVKLNDDAERKTLLGFDYVRNMNDADVDVSHYNRGFLSWSAKTPASFLEDLASIISSLRHAGQDGRTALTEAIGRHFTGTVGPNYKDPSRMELKSSIRIMD